jgi:predicted GNAT superfamily acetyltransferase
VLIRPLTSGDGAAALALNNANVPAVGELASAELDRLLGLCNVALAVDVAGELAAFCMVMPPGVDYASLNYRWFSDHAAGLGYDGFAYLDRVAVGAAARRRGVGRALYRRVVDALAGVAPVLFCEVNVRPRNDVSLAFHAALGFREVGQQDTDPGKRVSLLALDLPPGAADQRERSSPSAT